jgi:hypothetical protein
MLINQIRTEGKKVFLVKALQRYIVVRKCGTTMKFKKHNNVVLFTVVGEQLTR